MSPSRRFVMRMLYAVALCALVALPARASAADTTLGKLIIVKAEFGDLAADKAIDVTAKVAAMVKDNSLCVDATKANFGNPPESPSRKLKVAYTIDGLYRTKTVAEGETLDISTRLTIRKAIYGGASGPAADVTEQVAELVRKNSLTVDATNALFGDPAQGVVKRLRVDYIFDGVEKSKTVREGQTLKISDKGE